MDLFSMFKPGKYFDKHIEPKCDYCQFGKRAKDGSKVICEKRGIVECTFSCGKFIYSPLKRIPVKQLNFVGSLADEDIYSESASDIAEKQEEERKKQEEEAKRNRKAARQKAAESKAAQSAKPAEEKKSEEKAEKKPAEEKKSEEKAEKKPAEDKKSEEKADDKKSADSKNSDKKSDDKKEKKS